MNKTPKLIFQIGIVVIIIGAIIYLEAHKPQNTAGTAQDIQITNSDAGITASSTSPTASSTSSTSSASSLASLATTDLAAGDIKAKEITDPTGFINSPNGNVNGTSTPGAGMGDGNAPFTLSQFAGNKVILLDFWTYSCINCERTIPYLNAWYQKYKDQGLVIVGVHTPEFDFEKDYANVAAAVKQYGIQYPVVLDSNQGTWNAYQNQYWPHEYLIDTAGYVVHDHIGEGDYDVTEKAIQTALEARDKALGLPDTVPTGIVNPSNVISMDPNGVQSPETYFGAERNEYLANGIQGTDGPQTLSIPGTDLVNPAENNLYLDGAWNFQPQYAETTGASAKIIYNYDAKNMYMVAAASSTLQASSKGVKIDLKLDGVSQGSMTIQANKLYPLIQGSAYGEHTLEIDVEGPGLDAYTFTFG